MVKKSTGLRSLMRLLCFSVALCVMGCTSNKNSPKNTAHTGTEENDPYEKANRSVFRFNLALDNYVLEPVATVYGTVVPGVVRAGITNELTNLKQPLSTINYALAGEGKSAARSIARFFTNLFLGFFGFIDAYKELGMEAPSKDLGFDDVLAKKGVKSGPYIMLPILGPSSPRDVVGLVFDSFADPVYFIPKPNSRVYYGLGRSLLDQVNSRSKLLGAYKQTKLQSLDLYAMMRSMYWQKKKSGGQASSDPAASEDGPVPYDSDD